MRQVLTTPRFERRLGFFVERHLELTDTVYRTMKLLASARHPASLKVHKLSGVLKDCFGASISYEYRIVFTLVSNTICFIDIGSHDAVYR